MTKFAAIDFETANVYRHSACAIGVSIVENGRIVDSIESLICPPFSWFKFTDIHGLTWEDVCDAATFDEGLGVPQTKFVCTVNLARHCWSVYPTKLPDVCKKLRIKLNHHDAASDAEACARIVIAAQKSGWRP